MEWLRRGEKQPKYANPSCPKVKGKKKYQGSSYISGSCYSSNKKTQVKKKAVRNSGKKNQGMKKSKLKYLGSK